MDIRIIAKKTFVYAGAVILTGLAISVLNFSNNWILSEFPNISPIAFPLISSIFVVSIGFSVWNKIRESDLLKYEFITVVTHKFRTPLTHIKWATEMLSKEIPNEIKEIEHIKKSSEKLVGLTNLLVNLSGTVGSDDFQYVFKPIPLSSFVDEFTREYEEKAREKNITFTTNKENGLIILADEQKIKSVLQIILENAVAYTPLNGTISFTAKKDGPMILFEVLDSGIGISKDELPSIFTQFYRSSRAKNADTEGLGIGLYIARNILARHRGTIEVSSLGENKGTTFKIRVPRAKS